MATKKVKAPVKPVQEEEEELDDTLIPDIEEEEEELEEPAPKPKSIKVAPVTKAQTNGKHSGEKDEFGFGVNTVGAFIMAHLLDGHLTREQLYQTFTDTEFQGWGRGQETKRTKTSISVFLSDVRKPFGCYHASRSLIILEDPKTKKMSLDPKRLETIRRAVKGGILDELKGLNPKEHIDKIKVIRKKHGVPVE